LQGQFGFCPCSQFQPCSQEESFFGSGVGDMRFFLAESKLQVVTQEGFDFLFDLFGERVASPYSNNPIIGIPQIFDPDEARIVYLKSWKLPHLLTDALKLLCLRFSAFDHAALLPGEPLIGDVAHLSLALFMLCAKTFNELIEFMKVSVG
jgi:hypothetical protein